MGLHQVEFITCYGERKKADKLSLFLEADKDGEPFYKIEGSCGGTVRFAIAFDKSPEAVMVRFRELAKELLAGQREQAERSV